MLKPRFVMKKATIRVRWDWFIVDARNILDYVMWELYCSHRIITVPVL